MCTDCRARSRIECTLQSRLLVAVCSRADPSGRVVGRPQTTVGDPLDGGGDVCVLIAATSLAVFDERLAQWLYAACSEQGAESLRGQAGECVVRQDKGGVQPIGLRRLEDPMNSREDRRYVRDSVFLAARYDLEVRPRIGSPRKWDEPRRLKAQTLGGCVGRWLSRFVRRPASGLMGLRYKVARALPSPSIVIATCGICGAGRSGIEVWPEVGVPLGDASWPADLAVLDPPCLCGHDARVPASLHEHAAGVLESRQVGCDLRVTERVLFFDDTATTE